MSGIGDIPLRVPVEWDHKWFAEFVRDALSKADVRNASGSGVTVSGTPDSVATITVDSVSLSGLQDIATSTILGRVTAGTGSAEQLTAAQVVALLGLDTTDDVTFNTVDVGTGGVLVSSTKVIGAQQSAIASLTNSSGGSADGTIAAVGNTTSSNEGPTINDNLTELNVKIDAILAILRTHGLIAT